MALSLGTIYNKPWLWNKGTRVSISDDVLSIKIGGSLEEKKIKKHQNKIKSTKYNLITFLPQNLFEQFRRIANFYFLMMSIIAVLIESPVSPLTSLVPLIFVVAVTATKQGYEDFLRYRADNMVNYASVKVIRNGVLTNIKCQDIRQGDLVKVARDCDVPCDLVLLKSSDSSGKCNITTANLDGETNLKTLSVPKGLPLVEIGKLHTLGEIECENPKTDLYSFTGKIVLSSAVISRNLSGMISSSNILPLTADNLLLRGSRVKNTEWGIGCAVYTGQSTKLALNSKITKNKMSSSERYINKFLVFFVVLLFGIVMICFSLKRYHDAFSPMHKYYLGENVSLYPVAQILQDFLSYLILFNYLIPISLYVTIEMHKFLGSLFMEWDLDLYDEEMDQPCVINTSDLNEELGQVNILFSDKTGTLTKNEMNFKQCSINGVVYKQIGLSLQNFETFEIQKIYEFKKEVLKFFEILATCHTVQIAGKEENSSDDDDDNEEDDNENNTNENSEEIQIDQLDGSNSISDLDNVQPSTSNSIPNNNLTNIDDINPLMKCNFNTQTNSVTFANIEKNNLNERSKTLNPKEFSRTISEIIDESNNTIGNNRLKKNSYLNGSGSLRIPNTLNEISYEYPFSRTATRQLSFIRPESVNRSYREYYAAPSYTIDSLLERKESTMRQGAVKSVINLLDYQASSPDEKALVEACAKLGLVFVEDTNDLIKLEVKENFYRRKRIRCDTVDEAVHSYKSDKSHTIFYERLSVLEFTSDRKRMSVIIKNIKNEIWLYTKGAESHVLPLCNNTSSELLAKTMEHINEFGRQGLRTLVVARKKLTQSEFSTYLKELNKANNSLNERKRLLDKCQREIESNLELIGATAVEDKLQDNVKDTLEALRKAGIKIWVLTGDKVETALNIALACGHIPENSLNYFITECVTRDQIEDHLNNFDEEFKRNPYGNFALIIDGVSLNIALNHAKFKFRDISIKCRAVLCCRLSPLQKCEIVHLMKSVDDNLITAAIGDGANDVSMIQEAHVGLGIVGKEGRQAARCADYAFANFSMVKKILLVHGHYFSQRLAILVLYFFYKNLVFMSVQLFYQISNMYSSQSIYDSLFLTLYNVMYSAMPILILSLTEKIYSEEKLLNDPSLYKTITNNEALKWKYFISWILLATYHGIILYYFSYAIWNSNPTIMSSAYNANLSCMGTFLIHNVVIVVNLKIWLEAKYQTWVFILSVILSILSFILSTFIYNLFNLNEGDMLGVYTNLLSSLSFWLLSLIVLVASLLPDYLLRIHKLFLIKLPKYRTNRRVQVTSF